jgi:hypothetical protein
MKRDGQQEIVKKLRGPFARSVEQALTAQRVLVWILHAGVKMRVKSCICSRLQQLGQRRFDWRIARWLQQTHARGRIQYRCHLVPASQVPTAEASRWPANHCWGGRALVGGHPLEKTSCSMISEMKELRVSSSSRGLGKGEKIALPIGHRFLLCCSCMQAK